MKPIIYQLLPRLIGNRNTTRKRNGSLEENGVGKFNDINASVLRRIKQLGATHVWYTGIIRHATQTDYTNYGIPAQHPAVVKGKAGSPYAIADYYDVDPDLAVDVEQRFEEWKQLLRRTHQAGLKVIVDFIPNHVARQYQSVCRPDGVEDLGERDDSKKHFSTENNFYYCWGQPFAPSFPVGNYHESPARATGNDHFDASPGVDDWYETVKLNYGIDYCDAGGRSEHFTPAPDTWHKMLQIMRFWAQQGIDGMRCDMAEMVPVEFWKWSIAQVKAERPDFLFVGEVYNPSQYREFVAAGFDYLYDKVGMYDTLFDILRGNSPTAEISSRWQQTSDILDHMLYFLENHDELRIANSFFAGQASHAIPALMVCAWLHRGPLMVYHGQEFAEPGMDNEGFSGLNGRTTIFDYWCVESLRRGYFDRKAMTAEQQQTEAQYKTVMNIARREKPITQGEMFDLMYVNGHLAQQQYAFLRKWKDEMLVVLVNFAGRPVECDVYLPQHAFDFLQVEEGAYDAVELLSSASQPLLLSGQQPLQLHAPAYGGTIFKIKL